MSCAGGEAGAFQSFEGDPGALQKAPAQGGHLSRLIQRNGVWICVQTPLGSRADVAQALNPLKVLPGSKMFPGDPFSKIDAFLCCFEKLAFSEGWGFFPNRPKTIKFCCHARAERLILKKDILFEERKVFPFIPHYLRCSHIVVLVSVHSVETISSSSDKLLISNHTQGTAKAAENITHSTN